VPNTRDLVFWLPKLLDIIERPLDWVLFLLIASLLLAWRRRARAARRTMVAATLLLAFVGVVAVPQVILQQLEDAYPPTARSPAEFEGLLVPGGGLDGGQRPFERGQTSLNEAAERVTIAVALARRFPHLKVVLTGYGGVGEPAQLSEAAGTKKFFEEQGVSTAHLLVEPSARNTAENAENARALPGVDPSKPWLLVTSAWSMPRALLAFRKAGWNVEPFPVDYRTGTTISYFVYSIADGSAAWSRALHELLGMGWYWVTGRL
jgi:uncharacterized SAM-binding protein YcdF (DUF218 family)